MTALHDLVCDVCRRDWVARPNGRCAHCHCGRPISHTVETTRKAVEDEWHARDECTVSSWRRWYRWPVLWLLHFVTGTPGFRCRTCHAEVRWWP